MIVKAMCPQCGDMVRRALADSLPATTVLVCQCGERIHLRTEEEPVGHNRLLAQPSQPSYAQHAIPRGGWGDGCYLPEEEEE